MAGRRLGWMFLALALCLGPAAERVLACPFCGEANAADEHRVQAFQVSILFMLAGPMLVFGGFAWGLYRLNRRESRALEDAESIDRHSESESKPVGSSQ